MPSQRILATSTSSVGAPEDAPVLLREIPGEEVEERADADEPERLHQPILKRHEIEPIGMMSPERA